jgi:hypothetical protein
VPSVSIGEGLGDAKRTFGHLSCVMRQESTCLPTGVKACRDDSSVVYYRWPKLYEGLALARGDGCHPSLLESLGGADLLMLDDFGLEPLDAGARQGPAKILEGR